MTRVIARTTALLALLSTGCAQYILPDGSKLSGKSLCGQKWCPAGNEGVLFQFSERPYSPRVTTTITPQEAALQVVGRVVKTNDLTGDIVYACAAGTQSPFTLADVVPLGSASGLVSSYTRSATADIAVDAAVKADLDAIKALGTVPPGLDLQKVETDLRTAYSAIKASTLTVSSTYHQYALSQDAIAEIVQGTQYPQCVDKLKSGFMLITAAGILKFDADYSSSNVNDLLVKTQNELTAKGVNFNVGASVKRKVTESLSKSMKSGFQVLAWRKMGPDRVLTADTPAPGQSH